MPRELTRAQLIERSIQKKYRKQLWTPFVMAVKRYALIREGDRVAVAVSGGRDSMLLALLTRLILRYTDVPFEAVCFTLDNGLSPAERANIERNAALLGLPLVFRQGEGTGVAALVAEARALGCNKLALGHHFGDVVETTLAALLYGGRLETLPPMRREESCPGVALIRPLYCIHEEAIAAWQRYNALDFPEGGGADPDRQAARELLKSLRKDNPDIEKSVFNAVHAVWPDTFPAWTFRGEAHTFLERYDGP